jgi:DNA modification methylase
MTVPVNEILLGSCEDILKTLPDAYVDSIVTDPPYGLGTKEPTARDIDLYLQGKPLDTGGDFMGKKWEVPSVPTWKECYRVLKPGGYVLSFGGTRTWDIISVGLRAAGFDNRDTISMLFASPCLQWIQSQGFPKSLNISNELRKRAKKDPSKAERLLKLADLFEGYGTALKPAWEPILCFRKPLSESTVTGQIDATGTGGINIDGTRIKHSSPEDFQKHKEQVDRIKAEGGRWGDSWKNSSDLSGASEVTTAGRWPPNAVLLHSPECRQVGIRIGEAPTINRFTDGMKPFGDGAGHPYETSGGGTEEIPVYECVEGCPVKALDEQSGVSASAASFRGERHGNVYDRGKGPSGPNSLRGHDDVGGASRFFAQFVPDAPFFYTGKASKKEKNEGFVKLEKKKDRGSALLTLRENLTEEERRRFLEHWPDTSWDPKLDRPQYQVPGEIQDLFTLAKPKDNVHPCLHPDSLVMTERGYRPIQEIQVGQRVLAADGLFHEVEAVTCHPYTSSDLFEISIIGTNFKSLVTDNHPYLIWRPKREGARIVGQSVMWVQADHILKGDYTMTPVVQGGDPSILPPHPEDTDFWFIIGLYLAEGCQQQCHGKGRYPSFSLHEEESDLIDRIRLYCDSVKVSVYPKGDSKGVQVVAFDAELGAACAELCGSGAATKSIHPCVWNLPFETVQAFVGGYMAGDGGPVRQYLQAKSASMALASQMRFLAEMIGYKVEFQRYPPIPGHIGAREFKTTSPEHVLRLTSQNAHLSEGTGRKPSKPTFFEYEGVPFTLSYVKGVRRIPYVGDVVNLSVGGNHTFQTAVGMTHNTVKPVNLMAWLVSLVTPAGGLVLDPYCGSGTTCVAALEKGCNYLAIERDPLYQALAERRLGAITKDKVGSREVLSDWDKLFAQSGGEPHE